MNQIDLAGRRAVVTGGAQGIGRAVVERLLDSGASVSIWDRDDNTLQHTIHALHQRGKVHGACVDQTSLEVVEAATKSAVEALGGIDILVNNAGIAGPAAPLWEYPVDALRQVIDVDLTGVFWCCRCVVPLMIAQNYGRIVSVASVAGKEGNPNAAPYSAAKAGVIALTKSLGKELAGYDIAVNCVTPSPAKTRILDQITEDQIKYMLGKVPRGRFVELDEAASMIAWLVSAENSFTTAATFDLSGGRTTF